MKEKIYQKLADHLDQLPGGFTPSETGAELRLLQHLFTPQEAELAVHLSLERETAQEIAQRIGKPLEETEKLLNEMSSRGLIFSIQPNQGPNLFQAVPFVIGIYEFQVNSLDETLMNNLLDYWRSRKPRSRAKTIPQLRTIPIGEAIEPHLEALPYEQVYESVKAHDRYAVAPCICRKSAKLMGGGCDAPLETCLVFDEWADYYVRDGRGRSIDLGEVHEILGRADEANLVLQPTNSKQIAAICCCCSCCCGILQGLKQNPKPSEAVASDFIAQLDEDLCDGCWTCLDRCPMDALAEHFDRISMDYDRCIGCGLCVTTCPSGALTLTRKKGIDQIIVPDTLEDTWQIISQTQSLPSNHT